MIILSLFFPRTWSHRDCVFALRKLGHSNYQWIHGTEFDVFIGEPGPFLIS